VAHIRASTEPTSGTWDTSVGQARYATLPVSIPGQRPTGTLVVVEFRDQLQGQVDHIIRILLGAAAVSLLLAGVAGWAVAGRVLAPVRAMRRTAQHITGTDLSGRIDVAGNDDVAALARTFNSMLDRLQAAFVGQRQFLDDAGHELRTPITVIRGHLEVMGDDPADREVTVALALDELSRMSRIVDDLILLAKAEQADFLALGDVELGDLAVGVLAKAQALADRRWILDQFTDQVVRGDHQRLTQALMQLAANAARHTTPDDTIGIGTSVDTSDDTSGGAGNTGRVLLWVRDTGEGIDPVDHERIFDRFTRGTNQRRSTEGAGLGLAIVTRIAAAHGGHVRLDSTPGAGATFTLDLPLALPALPAYTDLDDTTNRLPGPGREIAPEPGLKDESIQATTPIGPAVRESRTDSGAEATSQAEADEAPGERPSRRGD
jgi:two-component system OmpR family sensor kinase